MTFRSHKHGDKLEYYDCRKLAFLWPCSSSLFKTTLACMSINSYSVLKMRVINNQQNYSLITQWQPMFCFLSLLPWLHIVCLLYSGNSNLATNEKLQVILEVTAFVHRLPVPIAECVDEFIIASATNPSYCGG